jgi:hypothetical protein
MRAVLAILLLALLSLGSMTASSCAASNVRSFVTAQQDSSSDTADDDDEDEDEADADGPDTQEVLSPEERMNRRFPQKTTVGHLIGLPVLDYDDVTLGNVEKVVRSPDGKIKLIVSYSKWFGWFGRPVAVPIEAVAILGRQIDSLDMAPDEFAKAPTWTPGQDQQLPDSEIIRIAIQRR